MHIPKSPATIETWRQYQGSFSLCLQKDREERDRRIAHVGKPYFFYKTLWVRCSGVRTKHSRFATCKLLGSLTGWVRFPLVFFFFFPPCTRAQSTSKSMREKGSICQKRTHIHTHTHTHTKRLRMPTQPLPWFITLSNITHQFSIGSFKTAGTRSLQPEYRSSFLWSLFNCTIRNDKKDS